MALNWLAHCGWELGDEISDRAGAYQHIWATGGAFVAGTMQDADNGGTVLGAGRFAYDWTVQDGGPVVWVDGQINARAQDYQFWITRHQLLSFSAEENLDATGDGDVYVLLRFVPANDMSGGDNKMYYGLGMHIINAAPASPGWKYCILTFNADGTLSDNADGDTLFSGSDEPTPYGGDHFLVVGAKTTADPVELRLFVDGVEEVTDWAPEAAADVIVYEQWLPCSGHISGKGGDAGANNRYDDQGSADGSAWADEPPTTTTIVACQPTDDVLIEWTGNPDTTNHYRNIDNLNDDCPILHDKETPTAGFDEDFFGFAVPAAGTVEGVGLCWWQADADVGQLHQPKARLSAAPWLGAPTVPAAGWGDTTGESFAGTHMIETPEGNAWTAAAIADFEGGWVSSATRIGYQLYAMMIGTSLTRPTKTVCPPAVGRRIFIT